MKNKIFNNKTYSRFGILSACLSLAACDLSQLNVALKDITNSLSLNCSNMEEGALVFKDFYLKEKLDAGLSCEESRVSLAAQQCQNEVLVSIPISKEIVSTCSNSSSSTAPKNCGDLSDGGKETKEFYASATVPYGELCGLKSPLLVRECVDGVEKNYLEEIKASGKSETCTVLAQPPVAGGSVVSVSNQWKNVAIADQNKSFQLSFDLKVSEATSDVVVGLSNKEVSAYQHLAPILRFNKNGVIDARDGSSYKADANVAYTAGETYRIDLEVHLGSGLNYYSVKARAKTATSTSVVANKFGFRTENASPTNLNSLAAYALVGTAELSNINVQAIASPTVTPPTPTPVAYVLSVAKTGTGTGVVSGTGINCGADCSESVASGSTVALSASASSGSTFQGWGGACTGTQSVCSVSMSQARQVSATFTLVPVDNNPPDNTPTTPISGINGPLRKNPANGRYFTDASGKSIYLTGSQTWGTADMLETYFNYPEYISYLKKYNNNFTRIWVDETQPWKRTGPGNALEGGLKFDLNKFDQSYFDAMEDQVRLAQQNGIYVGIMLFEGWGLHNFSEGDSWVYQPFHKSNNINGINGDTNNDGVGMEAHSMDNATLVAIQKKYIEKVVDTLNQFDNVIYEIANEDGDMTRSFTWQNNLMQHLKTYQSTKPKQHMVGLSCIYNSSSTANVNSSLQKSNADWISLCGAANSGYNMTSNHPIANGEKMMFSDSDHIWGETGTSRTWVWQGFTRGYNVLYMDPYEKQNFDTLSAMGRTLIYAKKINLNSMLPKNTETCNTGYCLANIGNEYLVFNPSNSTTSIVNLPAGDYTYEWMNVTTGAITATVNHTSVGGIFSPTTNKPAASHVLYVKKR